MGELTIMPRPTMKSRPKKLLKHASEDYDGYNIPDGFARQKSHGLANGHGHLLEGMDTNKKSWFKKGLYFKYDTIWYWKSNQDFSLLPTFLLYVIESIKKWNNLNLKINVSKKFFVSIGHLNTF